VKSGRYILRQQRLKKIVDVGCVVGAKRHWGLVKVVLCAQQRADKTEARSVRRVNRY
jgi:hypothetical protein